MREPKEIRKRLHFIKILGAGIMASEITINKTRGTVVFSDDENGWEHVSFSPKNNKMPSWEDMCKLKDLFWDEEEEVIQIFPKKSEYVNLKENCLHLWRNKKIELPE